jgi:hypothetical protein
MTASFDLPDAALLQTAVCAKPHLSDEIVGGLGVVGPEAGAGDIGQLVVAKERRVEEAEPLEDGGSLVRRDRQTANQ